MALAPHAMNDETPALQHARRALGLLSQELDRAEAVHSALRGLDVDALLTHSARREDFLLELEPLGQRLRDALAALPPRRGPELSALLEELPRRLKALRAADRANQALAQAGLSLVRGYVGAVCPPATAYGPSGARPQTDTATCSERA